MNKLVKLIRVNYRSSKVVNVGLAIVIDYETSQYVTTASSSPQEQVVAEPYCAEDQWNGSGLL